MMRKGIRKAPHWRTSRKGRKFRAGKGVKKIVRKQPNWLKQFNKDMSPEDKEKYGEIKEYTYSLGKDGHFHPKVKKKTKVKRRGWLFGDDRERDWLERDWEETSNYKEDREKYRENLIKEGKDERTADEWSKKLPDGWIKKAKDLGYL